MRIALCLAVVAASVACTSQTEDAPPDAQWKLVESHYFIERMPKNPRDMVHQIAFVAEDEDRRHRFGIRGHSSQVRILIDVLAWKRDGNKLSMKTLQTGDVHEGHFKAWKCKTDGFEICMELREGQRVRRYYSKHDWIIDDVNDAGKFTQLATPAAD